MIRVVAIDPGKKTGFAELVDGRFAVLDTVSFWDAFERVANGPRARDGSSPVVVIEVAPWSTVHAKNRKGLTSPQSWAKAGQDIGGVRLQGELLAEGLRRRGFKVKTVPPRGKIQASAFRQLTGYTGRTNEHNRDAGMMAWNEYHRLKQLQRVTA